MRGKTRVDAGGARFNQRAHWTAAAHDLVEQQLCFAPHREQQRRIDRGIQLWIDLLELKPIDSEPLRRKSPRERCRAWIGKHAKNLRAQAGFVSKFTRTGRSAQLRIRHARPQKKRDPRGEFIGGKRVTRGLRVRGPTLDAQQKARINQQHRDQRAQLLVKRRLRARGFSRNRNKRVGLALLQRAAEHFATNNFRHAAQLRHAVVAVIHARNLPRAQLKRRVGGWSERTLDGDLADAKISVASLYIRLVGIPEVVGKSRHHRLRADREINLAHHRLRRTRRRAHADTRDRSAASSRLESRILIASKLPRRLERHPISPRMFHFKARGERAHRRQPSDAVVGSALPVALEFLRRNHPSLRPRCGRNAIVGDAFRGIEVLLHKQRWKSEC